MSHQYQGVSWSRFKRRYDFTAFLMVAGFVGGFIAMTHVTRAPGESLAPVQLFIRAFGAAAFGLLHVILAIGPMARFSDRFKPLLFNRRHLGVLCFGLALIHAALTLMWYQGFAELNPFIAIFVSNPRYDSLNGFPFESLGFIAFLILALMAATSHDYWLSVLRGPVWKRIHILVYPAYGLLVMHVMLGAVQAEKSELYPLLIGAGFILLSGLHISAGFLSQSGKWAKKVGDENWLNAGPALTIKEKRARTITAPGGDRIAVFRYDGKVSAVTNVCKHQNGPLGEGCIIDGSITCPWHGWQYRPEDGRSPEPFTEKIATYRVKIVDGVVWVDPDALAPGEATPPAIIEPSSLENEA
jgi:nitrite reductase/ring-hydroxylating ferredoxin subunit/DMSO/TMAO reductase YedYZ heme-binding membrane subunit